MGRRAPQPSPAPRPEIAASWARSSRSGVHGDVLAPPVSAGTDPGGRLTNLAAPVLNRLASTLADTRTTVVLTDARAGVLDRRAGTRPLADLLDEIGLMPGYSYAEDVVGTNGMGTAAEERRAVR
ncbi:MAG: Fis family transcriptional regulator, partial [Acidimicrobiia bacterium]|nr:Fis family transcriptional regulator [Acidimicrobiia bacterium]